MDGTILDPDGARVRLARWRGRIDQLAADTLAMREQLRELRVTERDPGGLVQVTVDSTGSLVGLRLTERVHQNSPDAVARTIMATLAAARSTLADQAQEVVADVVGAESAVGRAVAHSIDRHVRGPALDDPDEDDEDYDVRGDLGR